MDYGDGRLDGVYQFNTKYRKKEMCETLSEHVDHCGGMLTDDPNAACAQIDETLWRDQSGEDWEVSQQGCDITFSQLKGKILRGNITGNRVNLDSVGQGNLNDWSNVIEFAAPWTRVVTCRCETPGRPSPNNGFDCNIPSVSGICAEFAGCIRPGIWEYPEKGTSDDAWADICAPVPSRTDCVLLPQAAAGACKTLQHVSSKTTLTECRGECLKDSKCGGIEFVESDSNCTLLSYQCDFSAYDTWGDVHAESRACFGTIPLSTRIRKMMTGSSRVIVLGSGVMGISLAFGAFVFHYTK